MLRWQYCRSSRPLHGSASAAQQRNSAVNLSAIGPSGPRAQCLLLDETCATTLEHRFRRTLPQPAPSTKHSNQHVQHTQRNLILLQVATYARPRPVRPAPQLATARLFPIDPTSRTVPSAVISLTSNCISLSLPVNTAIRHCRSPL